jgi:hypothetical protein
MLRECPNCHEPTEDGKQYCSNCGFNLNAKESIPIIVGEVVDEEQERRRRTSARPARYFQRLVERILAGLFLMGLCGLIGFLGDKIPSFSPASPTSDPSYLNQATLAAQTASAVQIPTEPKPAATFPVVPMGQVVHYKNLEIDLVDVTGHDLIYTGNDLAWYPNAGQRIIDLAVSVRNSGPFHQVNWNDMGITESNGSQWYANFSGFKEVDTLSGVDPFGIKISETNGTDFATFSRLTYLRLVFFVDDRPQTILFQIENSPAIIFLVK